MPRKQTSTFLRAGLVISSYVQNTGLLLLVGFHGISTFVAYLTPRPFYVFNQFYLRQFSLACDHSLIVKNISISNYSVLSNSFIQLIQFSVS